MTVDLKQFVINRQGKELILYAGLLALAHEEGLKRISTTLIQLPTEENANVAVVAAEVETSKGTFSEIGDASPANVNRMIVPHTIRMAATRAKARALRDAVNIGMTAAEEMSEMEDAQPSHPRASGTATQRESAPAVPHDPDATSKPPSSSQQATIVRLKRVLGQPAPDEAYWESMTSAEAADVITTLCREYNETKGDGG